MPGNFHQPFIRGARSMGIRLYTLWDTADRLTHRHFAYAVLVAFILHMLVYGIWLLTPRTPVVDIPVRVLNIKLGDMDGIVTGAPLQNRANSAGVEQVISKVVQEIKGEPKPGDVVVKPAEKVVEKTKKPPARAKPAKATARSKPFDLRAEPPAVAAPVMAVVEKQYVRESTGQEQAPGGHALGNTVLDKAQIVSRYEQLISAWIDKFKPEKITVAGSAKALKAMVRIRIDRRGNIRYMELDKGTGFAALDRAAMDTVRRANPVPAVPADYPSGEMIEFKVPVVFTQ